MTLNVLAQGLVTARRVGRWSAWSMVGIGAAYAVALGAGFMRYGLRAPITDPLLAVMEVLTLLSAPALVVLMTALHACTPPERRIFSLLAVVFTGAFAALTTGVHFVELTALRQLGTASIVWPSAAYALELLAWDGFLGLALVCAAAAIPHGADMCAARADARIRRSLWASGALCLVGLAGPAFGRMQWQFIGVFGYAVVLPLACYRLARRFGDDQGEDAMRPIHAD